MMRRQAIMVAIGLLILAAGCEPQSRGNIYVDPIFGEKAPETRPILVPDEGGSPSGLPQPVGRQERREATPRRSVTPVFRGPADSEGRAIVNLREPVRIGPGGSITMNFEKIAISEFARAVFGEILKLQYTIGSGVDGSISLQVNDPVPRESVYGIATAALEAVGVAVRLDGDFVIIERDQRAPELGPRPNTVIFRKLRYVGSEALVQALQPFAAPDARATPGPSPDMIVLSGSGNGVSALYDIVEAFDIDPMAGKAFALFPLARADAAEVGAELRTILDAGGAKGLQVIELQRINAIVVVSESERAIGEAGYWIRQLDEDVQPGRQVFVYQVQNRRAAELAKILHDGFSSGRPIAAVADGPTRPVAPALTPATETAEGGNGSAEAPGGDRAPASLRADAGSASIVADEGTNSLMITATADEYALISAALRRLDVQPVQVLIEATILEVTLTDALRYGVRWFFESGNFSFNFSDVASVAAPIVSPGFNFVFDSGSARAVISALDEVSDVEIVSSPSLMVLNNETARLNVGDQIGVPTRQSESVTDPDAPIVQEITRVNTGVILKITPRVNSSGLVLLDVVQEVSEVAAGSSADNPTISQRTIESSVLLRDRETLALGGLIRSRTSDGKAGIPVLSDVPILGSLFGSTDLSSDRTELLVIIRPVVVRNHNEARSAYSELKAKLPGLAKFTRSPGN